MGSKAEEAEAEALAGAGGGRGGGAPRRGGSEHTPDAAKEDPGEKIAPASPLDLAPACAFLRGVGGTSSSSSIGGKLGRKGER